MGEAMETQIRGGKVSVVGGFNGTSVVQTPLTYSRLTDPESFKYLFPVRLES
jgi:5-oxoprolinase (ATP-hydrolysing)